MVSATRHESVRPTEAFVTADSTHWLSTLAQRAGLGDSSGAGLTDATPILEAWQTVANSLGTSQADVAREIANLLHLPMADFASADPGALTFLSEGSALTYGVFPLRATDRELIVATSNPLDLDAEREIGFLSSRRTIFEIAPPDELRTASEEAYGSGADTKEVVTPGDAAADAAAEEKESARATAEAEEEARAAAQVGEEARPAADEEEELARATAEAEEEARAAAEADERARTAAEADERARAAAQAEEEARAAAEAEEEARAAAEADEKARAAAETDERARAAAQAEDEARAASEVGERARVASGAGL